MLVREGYDVRALVFYNSFNSWGWLDNASSDVAGHFEVVAGDIRDQNAVDTAVKGCTKILHLAALIAIPFSYHAPDAYLQTNIQGTLNVLQAARRHGVTHTICTSTSETYGSAQFVPITEEHPLSAQSPYAATKIGSDQMALSFERSFQMPVSVLRPFNTYGPRQSARAVIPTVIGQIAAGAKQVKLGSLTPTRDFTFVSDTARGFIQAMNCDSCMGQVTNIGSNFEISIGDMVKLIAEIMDRKVELVSDTDRVRPAASEVERLFAGTEKAKRLFGWAPEFSGRKGLARGLAITAQWFQEPTNLVHYKTDRYNI